LSFLQKFLSKFSVFQLSEWRKSWFNQQLMW
jgi:hypothetical protein